MRLTRNNIAKAIFEKHGHKVELIKGDGYYYFTSAEEDFRTAPITYAHGSSIYVNGLWCLDSIERWVSEYENLIEDAEVPEDAISEIKNPRLIKLTAITF